jgi:cysteine desulfurase/selenocysteine lyase
MNNDHKKYFPIFKNQPELIYLDNAATTQICQASLEAINDYHESFRANVHRGTYPIAERATTEYEDARQSVAKFLNASIDEIIFTSGTTHGLNMLAYSLAPRLTHRDNIVLTRQEHHANLVPWQQMAKHYGFTIRYIELTPDLHLDLASAKKIIDQNTKIVSFALVSNVLGIPAPAREVVQLAKTVKALTVIDAAQAAAHLPIDVKELDCDFLTFSGHKVYGPNGIGILYGKKVLLDEGLEPFFFGGEMVGKVSYEKAEWTSVPHRFEAGTPNISGAIGLGAAVEFLMGIGWDNIALHEKKLTEHALKKIGPLVKIFGPETDRLGIISFNIKDVHPHDIAEIMNRNNVAIRAGFHCAEPLHRHFDLPGTARISFGMYNSMNEIDSAVKAIAEIHSIFTV